MEVNIEPKVKAQVERSYILVCLGGSQFISVFLVLLPAAVPFYSPKCLVWTPAYCHPRHKVNWE